MPPFETRRHLTYLEHDFMHALFAGTEGAALKQKYRHLANQIQTDDLVSPKKEN